MKFVGDFHIHSRFARATSKDMNLVNLDKWAQIKGIKVMGTGDFTHPMWIAELKERLEPAEQGLYRLKPAFAKPTRFILTSEISCIYSKGGKVRKVHLILFAPSFEAVEKINTKLTGNSICIKNILIFLTILNNCIIFNGKIFYY